MYNPGKNSAFFMPIIRPFGIFITKKQTLISYPNAKKCIRILLWIAFLQVLPNSAWKVIYILKFLAKWKTYYVNTSLSVAWSTQKMPRSGEVSRFTLKQYGYKKVGLRGPPVSWGKTWVPSVVCNKNLNYFFPVKALYRVSKTVESIGMRK